MAFCASLPLSVAALNSAGVLMLLTLLWSRRQGDRLPWAAAVTPFTKALVFYCAVAVLASVTSLVPRISFGQVNKDFHKLALACLLLVALRTADRKRAVVAAAAGAAAAAFYGIGQALFLRRAGGFWERAQGFTHPVAYGELIALLLLGAICARLRADVDDRAKRLLNGGILLLGAALALSQARGALLGVAFGLFVVGLADRRLRKVTAAAAAGVPMIFLVMELLPGDHNVRAMFSPEYMDRKDVINPYFARFAFWKVGWEAFMAHPLFGVGPGNYRRVFLELWPGTIDGQRDWASAHNLYVHQAAERGLAGLAALGSVLVTMMRRAWQRLRRDSNASNLWAFAACAAFLVMNLTEVAWQTEQVASMVLFIWCFAEARQEAA